MTDAIQLEKVLALPTDDKAEAALLGLLLLDRTLLDDVADTVRPEDFYGEFHRHVWASMLRLRGLEVIPTSEIRKDLEATGYLPGRDYDTKQLAGLLDDLEGPLDSPLDLAQHLHRLGVRRTVMLEAERVGHLAALVDPREVAKEMRAAARKIAPPLRRVKVEKDEESSEGEGEDASPAASGLPVVSNFRVGEDSERNEVSQAEIVAAVHAATEDWPRSYNGLLFAVDTVPAGELPSTAAVRFIDKEARLFTWLRRSARVEWTGKEVSAPDRPGKRNPLTREELRHALDQESKHRYVSVELLPHQPPMPRTYYVCGDMPSGDGRALNEFMQLLNPDSAADADLLCAALVTPGWGGEPGARPGFVLTSDYGQGAGKTATAVAISEVWGGAIRLQPETEDWGVTAQRLLSDAALAQRLVLVDNLKGRLASGAIESAITEHVIDGKRMYHGQFSRPGTLTWMLTVNVAELSRDLAERCVVIKIGAPQHGVDFLGKVSELLRGRRQELVADCLAYLREPTRSIIQPENRDRFQAWQDAVLCRLPNGNELSALIKARRPTVDQDACEAQDVADSLAIHIRNRGCCPDHDWVLIPVRAAKKLLGETLDCRTDREFASKMRALCMNPALRHVTPNYRHGALGRGLLWVRPGAPRDQRIRLLPEHEERGSCQFCAPPAKVFGYD